jgi:hypothetical protein
MAWINLKQFSRGMHYNGNDFLKSPDELKILNGCNVDYKLGSITKGLGYSQIGEPLEAGNNITGLFNFRQTEATQKMIATVNDATDDDTQLFYSTGGAWTEIAGGETAWANEANGKVEMESMDAYCYFCGYDATDGFLPNISLTNTTTSTSTNVTNMPESKYIKRYRDRIYIGNCNITSTVYPYRVYYSSVPDAGAITWTVATDFLDVDYSDAITGMGENWDRLLVFTQYMAYNYDQTSWKKLWDVGCSSHRTIKNSGVYTLWANYDGVWMSWGGKPQHLSDKINSFIKAADMANAFAEVIDEEYHLYLGNITVDGVSYTNLQAIFNIPYQTWHIRECADTLTTFAKYNSSGKTYLWHGDNSGEVMQWSKYSDASPVYNDDTNSIASYFQTNKLDFGMPENRKRIGQIISYNENAQGLNLFARVVDRNSNILMPWQPLGKCTKFINEFTVNPDTGNFLEIKGYEKSTNKYWILDGLSLEVNVDSQKK